MPSHPDPTEIRRRVLAAWTASPARFREDANAEEDLVRGGYRDRLLVELAQNAADAATRAGIPGRLRLTLQDGVLTAANTGAPLDDDGVQALATLRASAKRDDASSVGRFGVGFAAVLAVTDEPSVLSTGRSVRFSAADTRSAVQEVPSLAGELARRAGAVPVLRLPFAATGAPPAGFDTAVVLPLRAGALGAVTAALAGLPADLLLALPGLATIEVGDRVLRCVRSAHRVQLADGGRVRNWARATRSGELPAGSAAALATEERGRTGWSLTWAVPLDADGRPQPPDGPNRVHAPTPSDEPLGVPARLLAPFPLGPDRRHALPGPVTDLLVGEAAVGYAELVARLAGDLGADPALLTLVPRAGLAGAPLDAALTGAVLAELTGTPWLPAADPEEAALRPDRAVALEDPVDARVDVLAGVLPGLLPAELSRDRPALRALGIHRVGLAELVEAVRGVARPPDWWARLYVALADADRGELAALPVPLADGRMAQSPAGVLLPGELPAGLHALGLRVAHPEAATGRAAGVLERLGARPATAAALLADSDVRAVVADSLDRAGDADGDGDGTDPLALAEAVLDLVATAGTRPGEHPWLGELALPDDDGGWAAAAELVLPGSDVAAVLAPGALGVLDREFARDRDVDALRAVGVLDGFAVVTAPDPDALADLGLDGAEEWADVVLDRLPAGTPPPAWPSLTAVRDLDLVADWARALPLLAALPAETRADLDLGGTVVPAPLRWWLRTHRVLAGRRPDRLRHPGSDELAGLYDPADAPADVLALLAPPATLDDVVADVDDALDLLDRLADPRRTVTPAALRVAYARLAAALDGVDVEPPERVRVAADRVVADAVVLDAPWLLPLLDLPVVPSGGDPGAVADLLDLPLASHMCTDRVTSRPARSVRWADVPGAGLAAARLGLPVLRGQVQLHDRLVAGTVPVTWWPGGDGPDAADGSPAGLGRALAWRHGAWARRAALTEAFDGADPVVLAAEDALEG